MRLPALLTTQRPDFAWALLVVFAFSAWSFTGLANLALGLLVVLFVLEVPAHWEDLRREPAFLLLIGGTAVTALLGVRAAILFPGTAPEQWQGVWAWSAPLLFLPVAWWVRLAPRRVWDILIAVPLGVALGVLRKTDWSLLPQVLEGMRYHFGYAALGLAFVVSAMTLGLLLFRARILGVRVRGRPRPALGWALWLAGLGFALVVLVVTQSRGAALLLAIAGGLYALGQIPALLRGAAPSPRQLRLGLVFALLLAAAIAAVLWSTRGREPNDWQALTRGDPQLSYMSSASIRVNLAEVGLAAFAASPVLGFGPGTSTTEFLVPRQIVEVGAYHRAHAPAASHLHNVPVEILARFGLVGALIAVLVLAVLLRAYRGLWRDPRVPPDLRVFLALCGVMTLFYCLYDFRLMNLDLRFFFILLCGAVYGLHLARIESLPPRIERRHDGG